MNPSQHNSSGDSFYITGGTLPLHAPSYVARHADTQLLEGLQQGQFCYVLNTRQMGKSSLMIRTALRLQEQGCRVAILDLTAIGHNLSVDQWYFGLLGNLAIQVGREDELLEFWRSHREWGPMQRFVEALRRILLVAEPLSLPPSHGEDDEPISAPPVRPLVVFVDEIDAVRSLPFSVDEFFAGIRECYNRRTHDEAFSRLTFCLLGVATPTDLIRDTRVSPFNIGRRIELSDFTPEEAEPLAQGLSGGDDDGLSGSGGIRALSGRALRLLRRVLHWTRGHPYMTQRLCQAVAAQLAAGSASEGHARADEALVDTWCERLFLSKTARETDDNLAFVRNRLLNSEVDLASLLDLYGQVQTGKRVRDDETNPLCGLLRLSGVVKVESGLLRVRNRVYAQVFDRAWVRESLPDAELRRQRRAYRLGVFRTAVAGGITVLLVCLFAGIAIDRAMVAQSQFRNATKSAKIAEQEKQKAQKALIQAEQAKYMAQQSRIESENAKISARHDRDLAVHATRIAQENERKAHQSKDRAERLQKQADGSNRLAQEQRAKAQMETSRATRQLYITAMNLIQSEWNNTNNFGHVRRLLETTRLQGRHMFEWNYWHRLCGFGRQILRGHTDYVKAIAYSTDGKRMVSGSGDKTAKIWDLATGHVLHTLNGHTDAVLSVAFSPDGKYVATASWDHLAKIWDAQTGLERYAIKGHTAGVRSIAFSMDGKYIVTGSEDGTAKVWDTATGNNLHTYRGHTGCVTTAAFSPDGKRIVTGSFDTTAKIWDVATERELQTFRGHDRLLISATFSPDGNRIATGSFDKTARVWDIKTQKTLLTYENHSNYVVSVAFSADGKSVLSASADKTAQVWDATTGQRRLTLRGHSGFLECAVFSPNGEQIATCSDDRTIQFWKLGADQDHRTLPESLNLVTTVAFSPDSNWIATAGYGYDARIWGVVTGKLAHTLRGHRSAIRAITFSPDGKCVATASDDQTAIIWDVQTERELFILKGRAGIVSNIAYSSDGQRLVTGNANGTFEIWNAYTGMLVHTFRGDRQAITGRQILPVFPGAQFLPDGKRIVTSGDDNTAKIWNAETGQLLRTLHGHTDAVRSVAVSPDGRQIVTASNDFTAKIWDVDTGRIIYTLIGHSAPVVSAVFSPDGKRIVTGSYDFTAKVWDTVAGQELLTLKGATQAVNAVAFAPNGKRIAIGAGGDNPVIIWFADSTALPRLP